MLVPIVAIGVALAAEFAIMYPVACVIQVADFAPSVMVSLAIAIRIDYSFFLLSRVAEQLAEGNDMDDSIKEMLTTAGHTIIASGTTLCFCFLCLLFLPMEILKSVGIGSSVAILTALAVNLSLTPALLYTPLGEKLLRPPRLLVKFCCARRGASRGLHFRMLDKRRALKALGAGSFFGREEREALLADVGVEIIRYKSGGGGRMSERQSSARSSLGDAPAIASIGAEKVQELTAQYDEIDEETVYRSMLAAAGAVERAADPLPSRRGDVAGDAQIPGSGTFHRLRSHAPCL